MGFYPRIESQGPIVIDITDLDNVRYCFLSWRRRATRTLDRGPAASPPRFVEVVSWIPPQLNKVWCAREYNQHFVRRHPQLNTASARREEVLDKLTDMPLVYISALAGQPYHVLHPLFLHP